MIYDLSKVNHSDFDANIFEPVTASQILEGIKIYGYRSIYSSDIVTTCNSNPTYYFSTEDNNA